MKIEETLSNDPTPSNGITLRLILAILSVILGSFQFGYNTGVINAPQLIIEGFINDTHYERSGESINHDSLTIVWSFTVAIFAVGGMAGGILAGLWADKFGRRKGIIYCSIIGIIAAALFSLSKVSQSYEMIIVARLIVGFNCGIYTGLVPMYLSEISPRRIRGALGTINQLGVVIGLLVSQILGLQMVLGNKTGWYILLGLTGVPAILMIIMMPFCPESPRYLLISLQKEKEARLALVALRGTHFVDDDITEMRSEEESQKDEAKMTIIQLLKSQSLRLPLVISVVLQLSQQLSGINAVFYYSKSIFMSAGLSSNEAGYATISVGAIMVAMTIITIPLMDRVGRRPLHLIGLGGMFIFSVCITIFKSLNEEASWTSYLIVGSALLYVVCFAVGPGSIPWMIVAELFSQGPRPAAVSIAVLVNWMANFVIGQVFPTMEKYLKNYSFLPFAVLLLGFFVFTYKFLPETRNKTFDEISLYFKQKGEVETTEGTSLVSNTKGNETESNSKL